MRPMNVHEAKTHFSKLLQRVALGEEVVIARAGHPVAKLVPIAPDVTERFPGSARGDVFVREDFDTPLPEDLQAAFE
ncbi:MAG: type II toxin-antitoxin system Phd/YefM family antitoxin [Actinobacteria bacterium]|nr:type II toxin-antitoxin system Phd/YefM family antitoxin [Actinomycetota bacterium]